MAALRDPCGPCLELVAQGLLHPGLAFATSLLQKVHLLLNSAATACYHCEACDAAIGEHSKIAML